MDLLKFAQNAMKSVVNKGGEGQPEWLRLAIAERLKARDRETDGDPGASSDAARPSKDAGD